MKGDGLARAVLIGGPQDGTCIGVDPDGDRVSVLEHSADRIAHNGLPGTNRPQIPTPWRDVTYQWDGTTTTFGDRRYRRVKP